MKGGVKIKKYYILLGLVLVAMLISGCAEEEVAETAEELEGEEKPTEEMKPPSFADVIIAKRATPHKLTYTYSTSGFKPEDISRKVTIYNSYPKVRIDGTYDLEESRIYRDGDDYTLCTQQQEWQCFTISLNQFIDQASPGITAIKVIMGAEEESVCNQTQKINCSSECEFTYSGTRNIRGEIAHCWDTTNKKTSRTFYVCWTSNGILLYAKVDNGDNVVTIETEEFSTDVTDSDFVPPAESISVSDMIKEGTGIDTGDIDIGSLPEDLGDIDLGSLPESIPGLG